MRDRIWIHHIGQNTCLLGEGTQEPYCLLHFFPLLVCSLASTAHLIDLSIS